MKPEWSFVAAHQCNQETPSLSSWSSLQSCCYTICKDGWVFFVNPNCNSTIIIVHWCHIPYMNKSIRAAADTSTIVFPISRSQDPKTALRGDLCFCNNSVFTPTQLPMRRLRVSCFSMLQVQFDGWRPGWIPPHHNAKLQLSADGV